MTALGTAWRRTLTWRRPAGRRWTNWRPAGTRSTAWTRTPTLARAASGRRRARSALAEQLALAVHWADLHAVLSNPGATGKGRERLIGLGGDGTPEVAEFALAEFRAVLEVTDYAVRDLLSDALDLRHRFPLLWGSVQSCGVEVWLARKVAAQCRTLSKEAAAKVDQRIAGIAGTMTWRRLKEIVKAAMLAADPAKATDDAEQAAEKAGVFLEPETQDGYQTIIFNAFAGDARALEEAVQLIARALQTLGDTRSERQRRAAAAGYLANPQAALDLIAQAKAVREAQAEASGTARTVEPGTLRRRSRARPPCRTRQQGCRASRSRSPRPCSTST